MRRPDRAERRDGQTPVLPVFRRTAGRGTGATAPARLAICAIFGGQPPPSSSEPSMRLFAAITLILASASVHAAMPAPADPASIRRVRADVEFLASDSLEGRDTGSRGYVIAADYVASQFRAIGLEPAGENGGWFQQVPFRRASFDKAPSMALTVGGRRIALEQGKDAALRPSVTDKVRRNEVGFVFVGYGLKDARYRFDDYRGLDVRGKIAVALSGAPKGLPSEIEAHLNASKDRMAAEAGAVGFIEI